MRDLGNRLEDATIDFTFHAVSTAAVPTTLAGTPVVSVYKANGITQSTAGVTLTVDFDGVTGLNHVRIDLSADVFYAISNDYSVVITTGTVDSVSVVGATVATFSIENRFNEVNVTQWLGNAPAALTDTDKLQASLQHGATGVITAALIAADAIGASELAADAVTEIRNAITGGAYALDTDANGRMRIVDGTGIGELDTNLGLIAGIAGTITTLDALDTAQDTQHATTQSAITALNDISVSDILTTQMTEDYAADGAAPTLAQALFTLHQTLLAISYSDLTATVKKLDGVTTAFTATLDDASFPTSILRAA